MQKKFKEAISYYTTAIEHDESLFSIIGLKRAICQIEINEIEEAKKDIINVKMSLNYF